MKTRFTPTATTSWSCGGKIFITNGDVADLLLVFGKWSEIADAEAAISALVVEKGTPGLSCCAPKTNWGTAPPAPPRSPSTTAACRARTCSAGPARTEDTARLAQQVAPERRRACAGIARAAFEDAVAYINERRQSGRRIIEFQGIQFMLADLASDSRCASVAVACGRAWSMRGKTIWASRRRC